MVEFILINIILSLPKGHAALFLLVYCAVMVFVWGFLIGSEKGEPE